MLGDDKAYSGLAVDDIDAARDFYAGTLGSRTSADHGVMWLHLAGGRDTLVHPHPSATTASYTILDFEVDDIDEAVDALAARGVRFVRYEGLEQDERGVARGDGPDIARFKEPAGNVLSVLQERWMYPSFSNHTTGEAAQRLLPTHSLRFLMELSIEPALAPLRRAR